MEDTAWFEKDSWWEVLAPVLFPASRWGKTAAEVDRLLALTGLAPGAALLDLCCGEGRHSLELARRGFQVTGVDRTRSYLERGRKLAAGEGLLVEFVQEDMRLFRREKAFDGAINIFTSFGYFADPKDDENVVGRVYESLKPGGLFLMDLMGKEILARIFQERDWHRIDEDTIMLEERKVSQNWGWIESRWVLLKGRERHDMTISHRLYSAVELEMLLKRKGFRRVDIYGGLDGSAYDQAAGRLVALAGK